jgi:aryl-alcohol dehydrogenase-like predicted oxidoreductase
LAIFDNYYDKLCIEAYCFEDNFQRLDRGTALAEEKGLTLPQSALGYVMSQPLNIFALVGCRSEAEFADNLAAASLKLTAEEIDWLERGEEELEKT